MIKIKGVKIKRYKKGKKGEITPIPKGLPDPFYLITE